MITAAQLASHRIAPVDYADTQELLARFARVRAERRPLSLTAAEFEDILRWKLGRQLGRQRALRAAHTDEIIRAVTGLALTISCPGDKDYELALRVNSLCLLRGVSVPVASAVLALVYPEEYAVIDFRVWRQLFGERRGVFFTKDYKKYMGEIWRLADELGWTPQEVDHAIWHYDRRK